MVGIAIPIKKTQVEPEIAHGRPELYKRDLKCPPFSNTQSLDNSLYLTLPLESSFLGYCGQHLSRLSILRWLVTTLFSLASSSFNSSDNYWYEK